MRAIPLLVGLVSLLAICATARADVVFTGKTQQSKRVLLRVGNDGRPIKLEFTWSSRCRRSGYRFGDQAAYESFDVASASEIRDERTYRLLLPDAVNVAHVRLRLRARRVSTRRWTGSMAATITIKRDGRFMDTCHKPRLGWSVKPAIGRVEMVGQAGAAPVGPDGFVGDEVRVNGNPRWLEIVADPFTLEFAAPPDRRLAARRYTNARRYPFNGTRPGLDLSGNGVGCNKVTGEFTITTLRFDARDRPIAVDASFVFHCEGRAPAVRGTVTWRE